MDSKQKVSDYLTAISGYLVLDKHESHPLHTVKVLIGIAISFTHPDANISGTVKRLRKEVKKLEKKAAAAPQVNYDIFQETFTPTNPDNLDAYYSRVMKSVLQTYELIEENPEILPVKKLHNGLTMEAEEQTKAGYIFFMLFAGADKTQRIVELAKQFHKNDTSLSVVYQYITLPQDVQDAFKNVPIHMIEEILEAA